MEAEAKDKQRKTKIQFSVPSAVPLQLDPRQVEMWVIGENGVFKPNRLTSHVYQPPSLKAVQKMAEAHMKSLGLCRPDEPDEILGEECKKAPEEGTGKIKTDTQQNFCRQSFPRQQQLPHCLSSVTLPDDRMPPGASQICLRGHAAPGTSLSPGRSVATSAG
ncbi:hypothetical protein DPEC_G00356310 [Dallia pectoralis]|uniref:Uncharacterized protein n=1 Tax=Dallia pectoralis TaxID=75939 RepID=A0ACC2F022_DALPE|nr:hypothetical protein DPEC_G00356310 [Dallia pectoralis]